MTNQTERQSGVTLEDAADFIFDGSSDTTLQGWTLERQATALIRSAARVIKAAKAVRDEHRAGYLVGFSLMIPLDEALAEFDRVSRGEA